MSQAIPWRVEITAARTDHTVMPLTEATGVSFERYIGKTGSMSCTIPIPNPSIARRISPILRDDAGLTLATYIYRGNEIWWGGTLDDPELSLSHSGDSVSLSGLGFEGYLDDRTQMTATSWTNTEQLEIARQIWAAALVGAGNLGITIPAITASGVKRDLTVAAADRRSLASMINEVANRLDGFEWMIDCYFDGTDRHRDLILGYPDINRGDHGVLSYPGSLSTFTRKASTARTGTRFRNFGSAPADIEGVEQLPLASPILTVDELLQNGALLIDKAESYSSIEDQTTLNDRTTMARQTYGRPLPVIGARVNVAKISPRVLGSTQRIRVDHPVFGAGVDGAPGYDELHRVIGVKVSAGERGKSEEADLIFEEVA
jgi:hypothetical protein